MNKYEPTPQVRKEMEAAYRARMRAVAEERGIDVVRRGGHLFLVAPRDTQASAKGPVYFGPGGGVEDRCPRCHGYLGHNVRLGKSRNGGRWLLWHERCAPVRQAPPAPVLAVVPERRYVTTHDPARGRSLLDAIDRWKATR